MIPNCIISYGTTVFLFLHALLLLSPWQPLTALKGLFARACTGCAAFVQVTLMEWKSSGPDSGPLSEDFLVFFVRWAADPLTAIYPVTGVLTAGLYWWLGDVASRSFRLIALLRRYGLPNVSIFRSQAGFHCRSGIPTWQSWPIGRHPSRGNPRRRRLSCARYSPRRSATRNSARITNPSAGQRPKRSPRLPLPNRLLNRTSRYRPISPEK